MADGFSYGSERSEFASGDRIGHGEGVSPEHIGVFVAERRQPGFILGMDIKSFGAELIEDGVHIDGVPQDDHVDDQTERAQLILLALPVALVEFAAFSVKDTPCQAVAALGEVELLERGSPAGLVVDEVQCVDGLVDAADLRNCQRQPGLVGRRLAGCA